MRGPGVQTWIARMDGAVTHANNCEDNAQHTACTGIRCIERYKGGCSWLKHPYPIQLRDLRHSSTKYGAKRSHVTNRLPAGDISVCARRRHFDAHAVMETRKGARRLRCKTMNLWVQCDPRVGCRSVSTAEGNVVRVLVIVVKVSGVGVDMLVPGWAGGWAGGKKSTAKQKCMAPLKTSFYHKWKPTV